MQLPAGCRHAVLRSLEDNQHVETGAREAPERNEDEDAGGKAQDEDDQLLLLAIFFSAAVLAPADKQRLGENDGPENDFRREAAVLDVEEGVAGNAKHQGSE